MHSAIDRNALILVLLATVGLSFKGIFVRFSYEVGMTIGAVLIWRIVIATPIYWSIVVAARKHQNFNPKLMLHAFICGNFFTIATICDFQALALMDVGVSRAILFTFPLFVQLLGLLHSKRIPSANELLAFAICYSGLILMLGLSTDGSLTIPWQGVLFSLTAAACYACFLFYGRKLSAQLGSTLFTSMANSMSLVWVIVYLVFFAQAEDFELSLTGMSWISLMVIFSTVIPFILLFEGMKKLGAEQASMIALLGPVISLAAAAIWLGETVNLVQSIGFCLVLLGIALLQGVLNSMTQLVKRMIIK